LEALTSCFKKVALWLLAIVKTVWPPDFETIRSSPPLVVRPPSLICVESCVQFHKHLLLWRLKLESLSLIKENIYICETIKLFLNQPLQQSVDEVQTRFPAIVILFMNISFASGLPNKSFLASSSMMVNAWLVGAKTVKGPAEK
jgi:hypothetical protein